ncbi:MAG: hypothetical protein ACE5I1_20645, partial [bacterium]
MISRFPKKWKRLVYEACSHCGEIEKKKIEERLKDIDPKLLATGRSYDPALSWLNNAETRHSFNPFHAIISNANPRNQHEILVADELDESNPLWDVPREIHIPRKADALSIRLAKLLQISTEILFVDPHFRPQQNRFRNTLQRFLAEAVNGHSKLQRIEYHLKEYPDESADNFKNNCKTNLPSIIPHGLEILIIRWRQKENGESLHARYVLTDRGGVRIDYGLPEGNEGETTDVSLLTHSLYLQRWADYQKETSAFEFV